MNVICYKRVSTEEQRENGFSLQHQEQAMIDWCKTKKHDIVQIYTEDFSGKDFDRPEWNKLMDYLKKNKNSVDLVLCYRWDRFGRNLDESLKVIASLKKLGVGIQTVDQTFDMNSDDPDSLLMKVIHLVLPEIENKKISKRTTDGMRRASFEGCWMGGAPIGYDNYRTPEPDNKSIIVPNKDAPLIIQAFEKMAIGNYSADEIRRWLNEKGVKICKQSMLNLIRNPAYIGKIKIAAYKDQPAQIVMGLHPPLISEDLFQKANEVLDGRKRNTDFLTDKTDLYPLKGFLMCPTHKTALTAYGSTGRNKKIHHYYICVKCQKKQRHRIGDVHKSMEDVLSNISITAQSLQLYKKILEKIFDKEDINRKSDIENLKNETARLNNRRGNLQERLMDNDITPQDYKEMKQKIESDLNVCQSKLNNLNLGMTP